MTGDRTPERRPSRDSNGRRRQAGTSPSRATFVILLPSLTARVQAPPATLPRGEQRGRPNSVRSSRSSPRSCSSTILRIRPPGDFTSPAACGSYRSEHRHGLGLAENDARLNPGVLRHSQLRSDYPARIQKLAPGWLGLVRPALEGCRGNLLGLSNQIFTAYRNCGVAPRKRGTLEAWRHFTCSLTVAGLH